MRWNWMAIRAVAVVSMLVCFYYTTTEGHARAGADTQQPTERGGQLSAGHHGRLENLVSQRAG